MTTIRIGNDWVIPVKFGTDWSETLCPRLTIKEHWNVYADVLYRVRHGFKIKNFNG